MNSTFESIQKELPLKILLLLTQKRMGSWYDEESLYDSNLPLYAQGYHMIEYFSGSGDGAHCVREWIR